MENVAPGVKEMVTRNGIVAIVILGGVRVRHLSSIAMKMTAQMAMKITMKMKMNKTWAGALQKVSLDGGLKRVSHPVMRIIIHNQT